MNMGGTHGGADLGGSSRYSVEIPSTEEKGFCGRAIRTELAGSKRGLHRSKENSVSIR